MCKTKFYEKTFIMNLSLKKGEELESFLNTYYIEKKMKEKNISKSNLCKDCKISMVTLNKILNNETKGLTINPLIRITNYLDFLLQDFFIGEFYS